MEAKGRKRIVITGASRGIGEAIALEFAAPSVELILVSRSEQRLNEVLQRCERRGATGKVVVADLSSAADAEATADSILELCGVPDVVVLNAGASNDTPLVDSSVDGTAYEAAVNYLAPAALMRRMVPLMRERTSSLVIVSSLTVHVPFPGNSTYAASKAALFNLARSMRLELGRTPLHVGVVLPGYTDTEMSKAIQTPFTAMSPSEVAGSVRRCVEQRRAVVVPGLINNLAARFSGTFPG